MACFYWRAMNHPLPLHRLDLAVLGDQEDPFRERRMRLAKYVAVVLFACLGICGFAMLRTAAVSVFSGETAANDDLLRSVKRGAHEAGAATEIQHIARAILAAPKQAAIDSSATQVTKTPKPVPARVAGGAGAARPK